MALAAAFSEETLALDGGQDIEVDLSVFPKTVFMAVMLAANEHGREKSEKRFQLFLECAEEIACGRTGKIPGMKLPKQTAKKAQKKESAD